MVKNPTTMQETRIQTLLGKSPGEGKGYPLKYSGLENSMYWGLKESDMTDQQI